MPILMCVTHKAILFISNEERGSDGKCLPAELSALDLTHEGQILHLKFNGTNDTEPKLAPLHSLAMPCLARPWSLLQTVIVLIFVASGQGAHLRNRRPKGQLENALSRGPDKSGWPSSHSLRERAPNATMVAIMNPYDWYDASLFICCKELLKDTWYSIWLQVL